ncbi:MAG: hypothetical protein ACYTG5_00600 [Planctomycetota bacterium]|jgi:hypothetical protein
MHPVSISICSLLLPCLAPGQVSDPSDWSRLPLRKAEVIDPVERGIEASVIGGKVVEIVIASGNRVPLTRPVSDWRIAELPGSVYVILAGGIRESLDLYLYASKSGVVQLIDTDGGRLLSEEFAQGEGSWPSFEGRELVFFPFEREDKLQMTVVNFQGQVLATQQLPLDVDGYQVQIHRESQQLRVSFPGRSEELRFLHPTAGRLVFDSGLVLFSGPERRGVLLRNEGRSALRIKLAVQGKGFRIIGKDDIEIPAQSSREVSLEMQSGADAQGRLSISSPVEGASGLIGLQNMPALADLAKPLEQTRGEPGRGQADRNKAAPVREPVGKPQAAARGGEISSEKTRAAVATEEMPKLNLEHIEMRRLNGELIEVSGSLQISGAGERAARICLRNRSSGLEEGGNCSVDGAFSLRMSARDEEIIEYGLVLDDQEPEYLVLGPVLPVLKQDGKFLSARAGVESGLMLLEVSTREGESLPTRVLRSWRLRVDREGMARVPLAALGEVGGLRSFLLLASSPTGTLSQSAVVRVGN